MLLIKLSGLYINTHVAIFIKKGSDPTFAFLFEWDWHT